MCACRLMCSYVMLQTIVGKWFVSLRLSVRYCEVEDSYMEVLLYHLSSHRSEEGGKSNPPVAPSLSIAAMI